MKRNFFILLMYLLVCHLTAESLLAARYVPIKIYLEGQLILEGNASDNGHPDADEVWDALKRVNLKETETFKKIFGNIDGDSFTLFKKQSQNSRPQIIKVEVAYGGVVETTGLRIIRTSKDITGRIWRIDPKEVSSMFNSRLIRRSDVPRLANPTRKK